ncbi:MAG: DUF99 family protein [archaeon]
MTLQLKPNIRVIGFDDGYFKPRTKTNTILIGSIACFNGLIEGFLTTKIKVDGFNSTQKIISLIKKSKFEKQVKYILLSGITFAGFNTADIQEIFKKTKKPVIVVIERKPNYKKISQALDNLPNKQKRLKLIEKAGKVYSFKNVYFQCHGLSEKQAKQILKKTLINSKIPEVLRLSHLIASSITLGQSTRP